MQYRTGLATVVNGNQTVIGNGTLWSGNVANGDVFTLSGSGVPYIVANVASNVSMTLSAAYAGANAANQPYSITTSFTPDRGIPYISQGDVDTATIFARAMMQIDALFGPSGAIGTNRVVCSDANGNFIGYSNLTYNGTTLTLGGAGTALSVTNNATIGGTLTVSGGTITTGSTTALSLATTGGTQAQIVNVASAVNYAQILGAAAGASVYIAAEGASSNIPVTIQSKGTGSIALVTGGGGGAVTQASVTHTASADRYLTFTGGVSGSSTNATIGVSGGSLNLGASAVNFAGIGTTASAANAFLDGAAGNNLLRSTSSERYKRILGDLSVGESYRVVLGANPKVFASLGSADDQLDHHIGIVAEELALLDSRLITRDVIGRPEWTQYPLLVAPLVRVAQDLHARLARVEKALNLN